MTKKHIALIFTFFIFVLSPSNALAEDNPPFIIPELGPIRLPPGSTTHERDINGSRSYLIQNSDQEILCDLRIFKIPNLPVTDETLEQISPIMENALAATTDQMFKNEPDAKVLRRDPLHIINLNNKPIYLTSLTTSAKGLTITMDYYFFSHRNNVHYLLSFTKDENTSYWRPIIQKMLASLSDTIAYEDQINKFRATFPDTWKLDKIGNIGLSANSPNKLPSVTFLVFPYKNTKEAEIKRIRDQQLMNREGSNHIEFGEMTISAEPALRFLNTFDIQNRTNYSYVHFIFTPDRYYTVAAFGRYSNFTTDKPTIQRIIDSIVLLP